MRWYRTGNFTCTVFVCHVLKPQSEQSINTTHTRGERKILVCINNLFPGRLEYSVNVNSTVNSKETFYRCGTHTFGA